MQQQSPTTRNSDTGDDTKREHGQQHSNVKMMYCAHCLFSRVPWCVKDRTEAAIITLGLMASNASRKRKNILWDIQATAS